MNGSSSHLRPGDLLIVAGLLLVLFHTVRLVAGAPPLAARVLGIAGGLALIVAGLRMRGGGERS
ncbi:hypothetical protein [Streptomyces sp. CA-253872]|uniref:hypothetical protein n=1 Tax=Streptomyces sp. CA-253872 TaxID=3240067 RepID=UPI003D8CB75F